MNIAECTQQITTIFGSNRVSLKSVIQKEVKHDENHEVTLVLITHKTREALNKLFYRQAYMI